MNYKNKNILYLDDDIQNLTVFEYAFLKNYTIFKASTVKEAWAILNKEKIAVLISDQRMPDQLGTDFLNSVSKKYPDTIRMLLTAYYDMDIVFDAINKGRVYAYITKPWDKEDLNIKIDNAIEAFNLKIQNKSLIHNLSEKNEELKTLNQKLRQEVQEKSILNHAIEQTSEIILLLNSSGFIIYANKAFLENTGFTEKEIIGKHLRAINKYTTSEEYYKTIWKALAQGNSWSGKVEYINKRGEYHKQEASLTPVYNDEKEIVNYVSVGRDITKEEELQELLKQKQKLEAIGTLAGGIAHDFNNILVPIQGYALLLEDEIEPGTQSRDDLEQIIQSTERAKNLVDQILTFSKKRKLVYKKIRISDIIKDSLKFIKSSIPKEVNLEFINLANKDYVYADPVQIQQIIINLCNNAFQAIIDEGKVKVCLDNLQINDENKYKYPDLQTGEHYIQIQVSDTGIGIKKEDLRKIFDPFYTTKEKGKGTGLGLSNVHGIVNALKGDINVSSKPGKGTAISVLLPIYEKKKQHEAEKTSLIKGNKEIIVAIDDDKQVLDYFQNILKQLNFTPKTFSRCSEAINFIAENKQKVFFVFTDYNMPEMTGIQLLSQVNQFNKNIPTAIVTGFADQIEFGNRTFFIIEKPFTIKNISDCILALAQ